MREARETVATTKASIVSASSTRPPMEMERRLMAASPATDDDLRELMQQRSASVQKFLLDTGKVAAERMFLVAPKPFDPTVKGMARATFSLD